MPKWLRTPFWSLSSVPLTSRKSIGFCQEKILKGHGSHWQQSSKNCCLQIEYRRKRLKVDVIHNYLIFSFSYTIYRRERLFCISTEKLRGSHDLTFTKFLGNYYTHPFNQSSQTPQDMGKQVLLWLWDDPASSLWSRACCYCWAILSYYVCDLSILAGKLRIQCRSLMS